MPENGKTHGGCLQAVRAFKDSDPLLREVDVTMIARAALFAGAMFAVLFAVKGWVVTWM